MTQQINRYLSNSKPGLLLHNLAEKITVSTKKTVKFVHRAEKLHHMPRAAISFALGYALAYYVQTIREPFIRHSTKYISTTCE